MFTVTIHLHLTSSSYHPFGWSAESTTPPTKNQDDSAISCTPLSLKTRNGKKNEYDLLTKLFN